MKPSHGKPIDWKIARSIFNKVFEDASPTRRMQHLAQICPSPSVHDAVVNLLDNYKKQDSFFDHDFDKSVQPPLFQEGQVLVSRFRVVRFIGRGGMGEVYEAEDSLFRNRPTALKTLTAEIRNDPEASHRFLREVELAQRVTHANICRIHEIYHHSVHDPATGVEHQAEFLTMQLLRGETLSDYLVKHGKLPLPEVLFLLRPLADALQAAHSSGVIHRDFKPANVMLVDNQGALHPVIMDFGLASVADRNLESEGESKIGSFIAGTPKYAPPEQMQGGRVTAAADIYSLGMVALEMLTGQTRDRSIKGLSVLQRQAFERCLSDEPLERYSSPSDFVRALAGDCPELQSAHRFFTRRGFITAGAGAAMATVGVKLLLPPSAPRRLQISKLAVLPFEGDAADTAMAGFHEELIRVLSKSKKFSLVAPFALASSKPLFDVKNLPVLLRLPADVFLTGTVKTTEVVVDLIDKFGSSLWTERFLRGKSVFALHHAIEYAILSRIDGDETGAILESATDPSPDGYRAYVAGRSALKGHSEKELDEAEKLFLEAIYHDGTYAPAWAGLAYASVLHTRMEKARKAADVAIKFDDLCAEAYLTKGLVLQLEDWKWNEAESAFKEALAREPFNGSVHQCYGGLLSNLGRHHDAIPKLRAAVDYDPVSPRPLIGLGVGLLMARKFDEAIETLTSVTDSKTSGSSGDVARLFLAASRLMKGDRENAHRLYSQAAQGAPEDAFTQAHFVFGSAACGYHLEAREAMQRLLRLKDADGHRFSVAFAYVALGERDRAFDQLNLAIENRDSDVAQLKTHIYLDSLRSDARYNRMLEQVGLA